MTKLLQQCFLFFIVVVIPGHNLGNSQVSVYRTIGPTLVFYADGCLVKLIPFVPRVVCWFDFAHSVPAVRSEEIQPKRPIN